MQNITYSFTMSEAWVETHAFTYQDVANLRFNCKISLCLKTDTSCIDEWVRCNFTIDVNFDIDFCKCCHFISPPFV